MISTLSERSIDHRPEDWEGFPEEVLSSSNILGPPGSSSRQPEMLDLASKTIAWRQRAGL